MKGESLYNLLNELEDFGNKRIQNIDMIINEPLKFYSGHDYIDEKMSILRPKNVVSTIEDCEIILLTNYDTYDEFYEKFHKTNYILKRKQ